MENTPQLQLEELLFPLQEVRSNQSHDPAGDRAGTQLEFGQQLQKMEDQPGRYVLMVSVKTNNETSKNPPYQFAIEAYAVLNVTGAADQAAEQAVITVQRFPDDHGRHSRTHRAPHVARALGPLPGEFDPADADRDHQLPVIAAVRG